MFLAPVFGYLGDRIQQEVNHELRHHVLVSGDTRQLLHPQRSFLGSAADARPGWRWRGHYSTIAPTIIADLYVKEKRTNMLSIFISPSLWAG
ncbi:unnamed protein product, partial [Lampetra planeri]